MKKLILFVLFCTLLVIGAILVTKAFVSFEIANNRIDAIKITGLKQNNRTNSIKSINDIVFKCSFDHDFVIGNDGDFIFRSKDGKPKVVVISCNKKLVKVRYYNYNDKCIYYEKIKDKEYFEIDTDYCKQECYYALVFIEDNDNIFYAKFTRK